MKKVIFILIATGLYFFFAWQPSTLDIARQISIDNDISYKDETFYSEWSERPDSIEAYVRRIDRHYDDNFPIITYDFVLTTGDYNDPNIVSIKHKGDGNYYYSWGSDKKLNGSIIFYHLIPDGGYIQEEINNINVGDTIKLTGKISTSDKITNNSGAYIKLMHKNHKFLLVNDLELVF